MYPHLYPHLYPTMYPLYPFGMSLRKRSNVNLESLSLTYFDENLRPPKPSRGPPVIRPGSSSKPPPSWLHLVSGSTLPPLPLAIGWPRVVPEMPETSLPPDPRPWDVWLRASFPDHIVAPMAHRHLALWAWLDTLTPGIRPRPKVDIWPRGGAKSSTAELGCAWVGRQRRRRFGLYVCKTQDAANRHVQSIAALFETLGVPRAVNEYGHSKGWTRQMLRTAHGFNLLAIGLDVGVRGAKLDELRPDLIILDDVDDRHDSAMVVQRKVEIITESILPAGSADCATLFIQNRIHDGSIAAMLADGKADFLLDRLPVLEEPAIIGLIYEQRDREDGTRVYEITGGTPTWDGQSLDICNQQINDWGRRAFLREAQHLTKNDDTGLWQRVRDIEPYRHVGPLPELVRIVVALDPSATSGGDEAGIVVAGVDARGHGYVLADLSLQASPAQWAAVVVAAYHTYNANQIVAEVNNGGAMVNTVISTIPGAPRVKQLHASRGKLTRAEPVQNLYERGLVHQVGVFSLLEDELCTWKPGMPSPNRLDALVWALSELMLKPKVGFV